MEIDENIFLWLNGFVGKAPAFDAVMQLVVSDYLVPVVMALTLLALWFGGGPANRQKYQLGVIAAAISIAISNGSVELLNNFYFRDRPFVDHEVSLLFYKPTDSSFPANSAVLAMSIATSVWIINRRVGATLWCISGLYAFSRVYAGVHYPLDVVAGGLIGAAAAWVAHGAVRLLRPVFEIVLKAARVVLLA